MKIIEPRSLLENEIRKVDGGTEIIKYFNQIKKLLEEKFPDYSEIDIFFAGWVLANPNVRDEFKKFQDKEIKRDNRISAELWRGSKK